MLLVLMDLHSEAFQAVCVFHPLGTSLFFLLGIHQHDFYLLTREFQKKESIFQMNIDLQHRGNCLFMCSE